MNNRKKKYGRLILVLFLSLVLTGESILGQSGLQMVKAEESAKPLLPEEDTKEEPEPSAQPEEEQALSEPGKPKRSKKEGGELTLTWEEPGKGKAVSYRIFRDGVLLGETAAPSYVDQTVLPDMVYTYQITAVGEKETKTGKEARISTFEDKTITELTQLEEDLEVNDLVVENVIDLKGCSIKAWGDVTVKKGGILNLNKGFLCSMGSLNLEENGKINSTNINDRLEVKGDVHIRTKESAGTFCAGTLQIGGDFTQEGNKGLFSRIRKPYHGF